MTTLPLQSSVSLCSRSSAWTITPPAELIRRSSTSLPNRNTCPWATAWASAPGSCAAGVAPGAAGTVEAPAVGTLASPSPPPGPAWPDSACWVAGGGPPSSDALPLWRCHPSQRNSRDIEKTIQRMVRWVWVCMSFSVVQERAALPVMGAAGAIQSGRPAQGGGDLVDPARMPTMAAREPPQGEPAALPGAMPFDRLDGVVRAGGEESAARRQHRADRQPVDTHQEGQQPTHRHHARAGRRALRARGACAPAG